MNVRHGLMALAVGLLLGLPLASGGARERDGVRDREKAGDRERAGDREKAGDRERAGDREKAGERREAYVDRREKRQETRINHGIKKGYLTPDEIARLEKQQQDIAAMEARFVGDGKLSKDEFKQLRDALDTASHCIWAEKHDTDGNQMSVYRLGVNVYAQDGMTSKLADPNLSKTEARAILKDFHRAVALRHKLATSDLTPEQRAKLQAEYNDLLNAYFVVRTAAESTTSPAKPRPG